MHHPWHSSASWNDRGHMAMHTSATVLLTEPPPLAQSHTAARPKVQAVQAVRTLSLSYPAGSCCKSVPIIPSVWAVQHRAPLAHSHSLQAVPSL
jgi:hypothetical protein